MSKRRLFNPDESSPNLSLVPRQSVTPNRGGFHSALIKIVPPQVSAIRKSSKRASDVQPAESAKKSKPESRDRAEDSDSDPLEVPGFFSVSVQKLPYTKEEDEMILKYVLKGQNIFKVGSILLWKHLEAKKKNPRRTYHSLKNRFLRNIKPCLFTTFGHLTKDKDVTERILAKFPELKQSVGRREILSNIKLPERKPPPKPAEEDGVSSTSTNDYRGNDDGVSPLRSPEPDDISISVVHSRQTQPESNEVRAVNSNSVVHERVIKARGNEITICVDFKSKKYKETPSLGIYEKFEKLKRKNRFGFCPTCGRYNTPKKDPVFKNNKEASIIPNSVETPKESSKSYKKHKLGLRSKRNTTPNQGRTNSEAHSQSPCSPSLLSDIVEATEIDRPSPQKSKENIKPCSSRKDASPNDSKASQISSSAISPEKPASNENKNDMLRLTRSRTAKEANSRTANRQSESDKDAESFCEDAMADFRKLIDYEEEQQLVRKCLNKNFKTIGLEEVSQTNWDSYFLDSSSDMDTPPLTIDFETDSQNNEKEGQTGNSSCSPISKTTKGGDKRKTS